MTKIVYITNGVSGPGGLERVLSIKTSYFADAMQYDVHIIALNNDSSDLFYNFSKAITFHNVKATGNPLSYLKQYRKGIKQALNALQPDVVCVCDDGLKGLLLPYIVGKPFPMVYERHASKNIEIKSDNYSFLNSLKNRLKFRLMDLGAAKYDTFVVLTHGNTKEWHLKNIQVIPNPLSFFPAHEELSKLTNKKVLAVGNHGYQKGYDRLLQSWKLVNNKHPDWMLEIYGKIDAEEKHKKLAKELGVSHSVIIHPPIKNIADKYQEASIYVMPSRSEGFGMVLIEAMAYGVPCISFDCPSGPKDIITNEKDGYLIENGEIKVFASKICELIENNDLRVEMGKNARLKAEKYLLKNIIPLWEELFQKLKQD
ncbi:glycosyltransferase family 4 protein [Cellulophaga sp. F20128]|uniref:glycosyltransferase family 4 protein n=1 Tax=Cellulophaga sp. F20128 TaxID=2926413 RepID=UPI001FF4F6A8|nr:glycosyltransferase family 4 protein [Cellulophaga sp. F20128]MCK0156849.1 glycosyltransferase family 4 protein [Cellulophaga sp. F20128]